MINKIYRKLIIVFSLMLLLGSCKSIGQTLGEDTNDTTYIKFKSNFLSLFAEKLESDAWQGQDRIGIFMLRQGHNLSGANADNLLFANRQYTPNSDKVNLLFVPASADQAVSIPNDGSKVDIIAFYPHKLTVRNGIIAIDLNATPTLNLLYSDNLKGVSSADAQAKNLSLDFKHALSAVKISLKDSKNNPIDGASVTLTNAVTKGSFDLSTGTFKPGANTAGMKAGATDNVVQLSPTNHQYVAYLIPQHLDKTTIVIKANGKTYEYTSTKFKDATQGVTSNLNLQLDESNASQPITEGEITTTAWGVTDAADFPLDEETNNDPHAGEFTPLSTIVAMGAGLSADNTSMTIDKDYTIRGVVVSDNKENQFPFDGYYHIMDSQNNGLVMVTTKDDKGPQLAPGTRVTVNVKGLQLNYYYGTLQLNVPYSRISSVETGFNATPIKATVKDIQQGKYAYALVQLDQVAFTEPGVPFYNGSANYGRTTIKDEQGNTIAVETSKKATFATERTPKGLGSITAVVTISLDTKSGQIVYHLRPSLRQHMVFKEGTQPPTTDEGEIIDGDKTLTEIPKLKGGNNNYFVTHYASGVPNFSLEYDVNLRHARWVAFSFDATTSQKNTGRSDAWSWDPKIPAKYEVDRSWFYGYDRGHIAASSDRVYSKEANKQTFYYTNMSPQVSRFNQGIWNNLEQRVQAWGRDNGFRDVLFVVKGGTIREGEYSKKINGIMPVPKYYWMALLAKKKDGSFHSIAFWLENRSYDGSFTRWLDYALSIDELEQKTGIDFFHNLPDSTENQVEAENPRNNTQNWPGI